MSEGPISKTPEAAVPILPRDARFAALPYYAEGGFRVAGVILLVGGLVVTSVILGIGVFFVSKLLYLILLYPIAIGAVLGVVGVALVKKGRVRSPALAGIAGFLGGLTAMATTHYCNYLEFMADLSKNRGVIERLADLGKADLHLVFGEDLPDPALAKKMSKAQSFWDYLDIEATRGVTLKRAVGGGKGLNLGYSGSWLYWGVETLIVAGLVFVIVRGAAQEPYCSLSDAWKVVHCSNHFNVGNNLSAESVGIMLREGELGRIAEAKSLGGTEVVHLQVYTSPEHSSACAVDAKLTEVVMKKDGKKTENVLSMATYPSEALEAFKKLCS